MKVFLGLMVILVKWNKTMMLGNKSLVILDEYFTKRTGEWP